MAKGVGNPLIFKDSEVAVASIMDSQKKEIAALYEQWADEIGEKAKYYSHKTTASAPLSERYYKELEKQLRATSQEVSNEVYNKIKHNIYTVADAVVADNVKWLEQFGFSAEGLNAAFSYVPDSVVRNIITGQIYDSGWSLSARIWGDNEDTLKDVYKVMAGGLAQQKPIYEIAKDLEKYVRPSAAKPWNLVAPDGKKIYPKQIDYNAQRLARTLVQHGYQQSFVATTQKNPFITEYIWRANGSRVCQLCLSRDGAHYQKDELPLDHPNGMCTMEPVVVKDMVDQLANWFNSPDGTYPEIDEFASNFGYTVEPKAFSAVQEKYLRPYGFSPNKMPKNFDDWSHKVSHGQAEEILHSMGTSWSDPHPYQQLMKYYNQNLAKLGSQVAKETVAPGMVNGGIVTGQQFAAKYGTSKGKTFNYWYTKLDDEAKAIAKTLKEQSGLSWQQWYEQYIYSGSKQGQANAPAKVAQSVVGNVSSFDGKALISRIKSQKESEMLASEARQFARMTDAQIRGVVRYTGSSYEEMNGYLRHIAAGKSEAEAIRLSGISESQLDDMRQAIAGLKKASLESDLVLRRGTDLGDLAGFMSGDFRTNKMALSNMSIEELQARFEGTVGTYAGFTSTSSLYDRGFSGDVEVIFSAPKGTAASSVMSVSQLGTGEGETLLNAGTNVIIRKIEKSDGHKDSSIRIFMEIIQ